MNARGSIGVRRLALAVATLCALLAAGWIARAPLLQVAARLWIVSDTLLPADTAVVLGGGLDVRPFAAARYYREHLGRRIFVSRTRSGPAQALGAVPSHEDLNRRVLDLLEVPAEAIGSFGDGLANTHAEAVALRAWAERSRPGSLIVPTEIFSSRRVRWTLARAFAGSGVRIQVAAFDPPEYTAEDWWRHEQGLIAFQNELLKYAYYRFKY